VVGGPPNADGRSWFTGTGICERLEREIRRNCRLTRRGFTSRAGTSGLGAYVGFK